MTIGFVNAAMNDNHIHRKRGPWIALLLFVGLATPMTIAQDDETAVMPAGKLELSRLVDLAAQQMHVNIEYDAAVLRGDATVRLKTGLTNAELWLLMNRVLASRGFTTVRAPGDVAYSVVSLADASTVVEFNDRAQSEGPPPGYQMIVARVQHRIAADLVEPLSQVVSRPSGSVVPLSDELLLVSDLSDRLDSILALLSVLDVPAQAVGVEEVPLKHLSGLQMATLVAQVLAKRELAGEVSSLGEVLPAPDTRAVLLVAPDRDLPALRDLVATLDRRERTDTVTYSPVHFPANDVATLIEKTIQPAAGDQWHMVVDDLTGTLVVTTTPALHESIQSLIDRLDSAAPSSRRPVRTYVVRNRSVTEVLGILEHLVSAGVLEATDEPVDRVPTNLDAVDVMRLPPPPAGSTSDPESLLPEHASPSRSAIAGGTLTLTADEGTNTLIAVGAPRQLAQIETLLHSLDVRQPQVMLEVLMVTITEGESIDLGIELERLTTADDAQIRLSSLFGLGVRSDSGDLTGPDLATGFTGVVLSPAEFSIVVRALETINYGRSLSMPKILVGNNQQATLDAVVQQPFASVNASNTVSTTSFGGTQDAGTVVTIKPQIAKGDHLLLDYSVSLSSFLGSAADATLPPPRQQNSLRSIATIPDGYTVVLGGIELEDQSRGTSQVPVLGDIPLIGEAFKSRRNTDSKARFFVFIRANVLRSPDLEDLKYISSRDLETAGLDDGWPTVEPRIIP